jgi:hypothetical protein
VRSAIENAERFGRADAEQALCHAIWSDLDVAIENENENENENEDDVSPVETALDALRAEMAGRVYMSRLSLGWLTRSAAAPAVPPTLDELSL